MKNEKEKKTLIKNKEDKTKEQENKNEHPDSNANDQERSQSENPETANDEGETQSPKANWDCLKMSKLIGVIILVGCSIGFLVLLIQSFSFGKSQETEMPTTQPPFLSSTIRIFQNHQKGILSYLYLT